MRTSLMLTERGERANVQNEIGDEKHGVTGSGTVVQSTLRAVPATVPDPVLNQGGFLRKK